MSTMTAIFENGVFRPLGTVRLPEHTPVQVSLPDMEKASARDEADKATLLAEVRSLHGSLHLPAGTNDEDLITAARMEKYGPL